METHYKFKRTKMVKLFIGERKLDEMIVEMLDDRYPAIRIGWRKPHKELDGWGDIYKQFYLKFEMDELEEDGSLRYKMTDIEGVEVKPPKDDEDWFVYDSFIDKGVDI
jgi:hypothetical protein